MEDWVKSTVVVLLLIILAACAPASAANITSLQLFRGYPGDAGIWATNGYASIGVTNIGAPDNSFLNPLLGTGGIANGTYLLFLGYEDYWTGTGHPATNILLTVNYADGTSSLADFNIGSFTTLSAWTRNSGAPTLFLGGSGVSGVDRVGDGNTLNPNGVNDIVLRFSDAGGFGSVPEPVSLSLMAAALGLGFLLKRRR
jgi:hypothetical protein